MQDRDTARNAYLEKLRARRRRLETSLAEVDAEISRLLARPRSFPRQAPPAPQEALSRADVARRCGLVERTCWWCGRTSYALPFAPRDVLCSTCEAGGGADGVVVAGGES